jgi:hypothetical protein
VGPDQGQVDARLALIVADQAVAALIRGYLLEPETARAPLRTCVLSCEDDRRVSPGPLSAV